MTIPVTPQIYIPRTTQAIPQALSYQTVPIVQSIPQIPIGKPIVRTMQINFQGQDDHVPPFQRQAFQSLPFQG